MSRSLVSYRVVIVSISILAQYVSNRKVTSTSCYCNLQVYSELRLELGSNKIHNTCRDEARDSRQ